MIFKKSKIIKFKLRGFKDSIFFDDVEQGNQFETSLKAKNDYNFEFISSIDIYKIELREHNKMTFTKNDKPTKYDVGILNCTRGVYEDMEKNEAFKTAIYQAINRYLNCDWGIMPKEDKKLNDNAITYLNDRIVARYNTPIDDIYIITQELNETSNYTMVMYCNEY